MSCSVRYYLIILFVCSVCGSEEQVIRIVWACIFSIETFWRSCNLRTHYFQNAITILQTHDRTVIDFWRIWWNMRNVCCWSQHFVTHTSRCVLNFTYTTLSTLDSLSHTHTHTHVSIRPIRTASIRSPVRPSVQPTVHFAYMPLVAQCSNIDTVPNHTAHTGVLCASYIRHLFIVLCSYVNIIVSIGSVVTSCLIYRCQTLS